MRFKITPMGVNRVRHLEARDQHINQIVFGTGNIGER